MSPHRELREAIKGLLHILLLPHKPDTRAKNIRAAQKALEAPEKIVEAVNGPKA